MFNRFVFISLFILSFASLFGQTRVYIEDRSTDFVGGKLLTAIRDSVKADPDFLLLTAKDKDHYYLFIKFVSIDRHKDEGEKEGYGSIYMVLWFIAGQDIPPYYIDYKFGYASEDTADELGGEVVDKTRAAIALLEKLLNEETDQTEK